MTMIGRLTTTNALGSTLRPYRTRTNAKVGAAFLSDDNEAALRAWRTYRAQNGDFTQGFKTVLTTLKKNTTALLQSTLTTHTNSSTGNTTNKATYDHDNMIQAAKEFADTYNDTLDYLKKKSKYSGVKDVLKNYKQTSRMKEQLARVGISVDRTGKLTVDEDSMKKALEKDDSVWDEVVAHTKSSLVTRVSQKNSYYLKHLDDILMKPAVILTT